MAYLYVVTPDQDFLLFKGDIKDDRFEFTHPLTHKKVSVRVDKRPGIIFADRLWLVNKDDEKANNAFKAHPFTYLHREILYQKDIPKKSTVFYKCNQRKCKNCTADQDLCTNTMNVRFAKTPEIFRQFVYDFMYDQYRQIETNVSQAFKLKGE